MNLTKIIDDFLSQYGRVFTIDDYTGKCILSSKGGQNANFLSEEIDRLSSSIVGNFIMFCSPTTKITVNDIVNISEIPYAVKAIEYYNISDSPIYKWAILERRGATN